MKCKHCHAEKNQIKAGKTAIGSQKYKCKVCGKARRYYSDAYTAYSEKHYDGKHMSLKNKSQTYTVKGVNLT